jgi:LmbE family N-acetylglucosaminyl deacetylase
MAANRTVLTFLAHPDDAEFLCGGVLCRLADLGWNIHIATMTAGDCGTMTDTPWQISATRTGEAEKAANLLDGKYHCLGERDLFVCYDKPTVQKAIDLFRVVNPALVLTHAPKDYMMDHEMTSLICRAASFGFGAPNASTTPLCAEAKVPHLYYCDPIEGRDPLGNMVEPTTWIDISEQIEQKAEMLACHESQRAWLREHHGMDEYIEAMKRQSAMRGTEKSVPFAEGFVQHRGHPYPSNDILVELLAHRADQ